MSNPKFSDQVLTRIWRTASNAIGVDLSGATIPASAGRSNVALARIDYMVTTVTTSAYTQLVASLSDTVNSLFIFDSSGKTLFLAVGAAGFEVDQIYIVPGGNGQIDLAIPSGSRVSIKAIGANATKGEINVSFLK